MLRNSFSASSIAGQYKQHQHRTQKIVFVFAFVFVFVFVGTYKERNEEAKVALVLEIKANNKILWQRCGGSRGANVSPDYALKIFYVTCTDSMFFLSCPFLSFFSFNNNN